MNSCDQDILSLYLDGALTLPQRVHLESHLRACEDCAHELADLRRIDQVLSSWGAVRVPVPPETSRRLMRSVERKRKLGPLAAFGRMVPAAFGTGIAALLILVSVNSGIINQSSGPAPAPKGPPVLSRGLIKQSERLISARRSSAVLGSSGVHPQLPTVRHISLEVN
jgi:anti-sigma factor RsiW